MAKFLTKWWLHGVLALVAIAVWIIPVMDMLGQQPAEPPVSQLQRPGSSQYHPSPYRPVDDFASRNPLVRVRKVLALNYNSRLFEMLIFVEGTSGDRAVIPYWIPRGQFIDRYPPYLPMEGEVWRVGHYYSGNKRRIMLRSLWSKVGQDPGTAMPGEGVRPPSGIGAIGAGPPKEGEEDKQPELTPESFMGTEDEQ